MNTIKLGTILATSAIVFGAMAPAAFAATNVVVSNNGSLSKNNVKVKNAKVTSVAQTNKAKVSNVVTSKANTGGNKVSFNTGGSTGIKTGSSTSTVGVTVHGNSNTAAVEPNCNCASETAVGVTENGVLSHNNVQVSNGLWFTAIQSNVSHVMNAVSSSAKTGGNTSSFNTGGSTSVETSSATSNVSVTVHGSSNTLSQ